VRLTSARHHADPEDAQLAQWIVGAAALAGTWAVVEGRPGTLPKWEATTLAAVNGLPDSLQPVVWPVMQVGNFWMCAAAAPAGFALGRRVQTSVAWSGSVILAWGAAKAIKRIVRRGRPIDFLPATIVRERGITGMGYVSGHTAIAFALPAAAWPYIPRGCRALSFVIASAVGLSRVYVGAHLPLDVIGGAGLGVLCGLAASAVVGGGQAAGPADSSHRHARGLPAA
jgi:glycosyltransferase 2 family protein